MVGVDVGEAGVQKRREWSEQVLAHTEELGRLGELFAESGLGRTSRKILANQVQARVRRIRDLMMEAPEAICSTCPIPQAQIGVGAEREHPTVVSLFELVAEALLLASVPRCADPESRRRSTVERTLQIEDDLPRFVIARGGELRRLLDLLTVEVQDFVWDEMVLRARHDLVEVGVVGPRPRSTKEPDAGAEALISPGLRLQAERFGATISTRHEPLRSEVAVSFRKLPDPVSDAWIRPGRLRACDLGRVERAEEIQGLLKERRILTFGLDPQRVEMLRSVGAEVDEVESVARSREIARLVTKRADLWVWCDPDPDQLRPMLELLQCTSQPLMVLGAGDALEGDVLAAGGRHVPLTIDGDALRAEILEIVTLGYSRGAPELPTNVSPAVSSMMDDPEYGAMVERYVEAVPNLFKEVSDARADEDITGLRSAAHRIKGSARLYGYEELSAAGAMCQFAIDDQVACDERESAVDSLLLELQRVLYGANARRPVRAGRL